jgi:hypothetical protein
MRSSRCSSSSFLSRAAAAGKPRSPRRRGPDCSSASEDGDYLIGLPEANLAQRRPLRGVGAAGDVVTELRAGFNSLRT